MRHKHAGSDEIAVEFVLADDTRESVVGSPGDTVMDAALDNNVPGILAQCGGGCTCCTCHCWVDESWFAKLEPPHQDELDMLEYAWGRTGTSRLACQVVLHRALDGIVIKVPERQA